MKLNNLFETENSPQEEHEFLRMLIQSCKDIPDHIDYDYAREGQIIYPRGKLLNYETGLFRGYGTCIVSYSEDIIAHIKNEKVILYPGGFDGDWEDFFVTPDSNYEILLKIASDEPEKIMVTFKGKKFILSEEELIKVFDKFFDTKVAEYRRTDGLSNDQDDEDNYGRRRWRSADDYDEPEYDENSYNYKDCTMYGSFVYKNLSHD